MFEHAEFFAGMIAMGMLVCAAFFFRFWLRSKDSLFLAFAVAFLLLTISHALSGILQLHMEERNLLYVLRLAAYAILVFAILQKNAPRRLKRDAEHPPSNDTTVGVVASFESVSSSDGLRAFQELALHAIA